jgi:GT2 family glycosyltransferase
MSGVTVVVPNWNRGDLLSGLIAALKKQTSPISELLVVDNGSTDASVETARAQGARVIEMGSNSGFSRAVNCGILSAETPWVAIVNNDVQPAPDWLEQLLLGAQDRAVWFATGKLLEDGPAGRLDGTFDTVCRGACSWRAGKGRLDSAAWETLRPIRMAPMTAALFRKELFDRVGLLDERFESYLEDVDFGLRCAARGLGGVYVPGAVAFHSGSATLGAWSPDTVRRLARNQLWLVAKHFPAPWIKRYGWPVLVAQTFWGLLALSHGTGLAWLRGKWEGLRQFGQVRDDASATRLDEIAAVLDESEQELLTLQRQTGPDLFWRLYSALT